MKKIFVTTIIGIILFSGCMVYIPDDTTETKSETLTEEPATQEEEPAPEDESTETQTTEIPVTRVKSLPPDSGRQTAPELPEEAESDTEGEVQTSLEIPEETETQPEIAETRSVDWVAFYRRVEQKGREKYNKKLPWNSLAKDAGLRLGSWMVDAGSCNRNPPTEEEVRKIADVLNVSYEWLLYGDD